MKLNFSYDEDLDILTIESIRYSGTVFRDLAFCAIGSHFEISDREDGTIVLTKLP